MYNKAQTYIARKWEESRSEFHRFDRLSILSQGGRTPLGKRNGTYLLQGWRIQGCSWILQDPSPGSCHWFQVRRWLMLVEKRNTDTN